MKASASILPYVLLVTGSVGLSGCATTLQPAPDAQIIDGEDTAALAEAGGVQIVADADDWSAFPRELVREMTPVRATIVNNSDRALKLEYEQFVLKAEEGVSYHPLPPIDIKGSVTRTSQYPILAPRFAHRGFWVAPYYHPYFTGLNPWAYTWPYDPLYYSRYYPQWRIDLPTHEMIELAIPEGVIDPKGQVSGFLYFPELRSVEDGDRVTFTANLVDAKTDAAFGSIQIPFVAE